MRISLLHVLAAGIFFLSLAACGGSKPSITEPVGRVQLGMTVQEVTNVLGSGQVVEPAQSDGAHTMEVREFPASNNRIYVVRFIDGLVRRWEIQSR